MKVTIHTSFKFDAAHKLEGYDGPCANLHGHTWKVDVWLTGSTNHKDHIGMLLDFREIKNVEKELDHKLLNDTLAPFNPTAENISEYIFNKLKAKLIQHERLYDTNLRVRVYESEDSYAEVYD